MPSEFAQLMQFLDTVELPEGIYATVLADDLGAPWGPEIVVWGDRWYNTCPTCDEEVTQSMEDDCPVTLKQGDFLGCNQEHRCGDWLSVLWEGVGSGLRATGADVLCVARAIEQDRDDRQEADRERVRKQVRTDLANAVRRLAEPLRPGETKEDREAEVTTGQVRDPEGIAVDASTGLLMAWAYLPGISDDPYTVYQQENAHE